MVDSQKRKRKPIPASLSEYAEWRSPREGSSNPTRMDNPAWTWLIKSKVRAYEACQRYGVKNALVNGPTWCFERFGQSITSMPDGRIIHIGGEHEDYYDPDFHIYNDVVVIDASGEVSIYGYPKDVFPPTDFHTATLAGNEIYVIGRLGYQQDRQEKIEAIHVLNTATYCFRMLQTSGDTPPWIHEHHAELDPAGTHIRISGGKIDCSGARMLVENLDTWELRLDTGVWTHVARRPWRRWEIVREERSHNAIWEIRQMLWNKSAGWTEDYEASKARLAEMLGVDAEPEVIGELYRPPMEHRHIEKSEDEFDIQRISVEGITVRYNEGHAGIVMTVEGVLPDAAINSLLEDICRKLRRVEGKVYKAKEIGV